PKNTSKYEGTPEQWDEAQRVMGELLDDLLGRENYAIGIDEAAFYGPKLDIQCKNVFGKEDTIVTIQIDMLLAKKFGMEYVDSDNSMTTPYIIHRTSLGCYERTLALLLEKYAGALPLWLSPNQITVIPVSLAFNDYAQKVKDALTAIGVRAEAELGTDTMKYKIRAAQLEKTPYIVIVGENEMNTESVSVRARVEGEGGVMSLEDFKAKLLREIAEKKR
ncbi:MAG: threonine--tRNA ligase, partial [Clostridia bacterium]|nr:threonine--tRNA ligase [Clostridia bacterium]